MESSRHLVKMFNFFSKLMKILGISSINVCVENNSYKCSRKFNIISNIILITLAAIMFLNREKLFGSEEKKETFILSLVDVIYFLTPHMNTIFILTTFKIKQKQIVRIFKNFCKFVNDFENHSVVKIAQFLKKAIVIFVVDMVLYNFVFILPRFGYSWIQNGTFDIWLVVIYLTFNYNYILKSFVEIFHSVMVHLIIHFFEEAHQRFAQASKTGMIEDVRNILRMHQELCDVVRQLNEIFSLQLLFLIGTYFKIIFINVFFFYADFGTNIQLTSFYYTSVNCIKLIFCVYSCNKCAQQVTKSNSCSRRLN
jgi:hypothetical protein